MKKVLCIVPHADDDILSFGSLLRKYSNEGCELFMVYLTIGGVHRLQNYDLRMAEMNSVCDSLKVPMTNRYVLFKNKDAEMDSISIRVIATEIDKLMDQIKPEILLTTLNSNHQDHQALYKAIRVALRMKDGFIVPRVLFGEYPFINAETDISFNGKIYLEMNDDQLQDKLDLFNLYKTQVRPEPSPLGNRGVRNLAERRGIEFGCKYAECYFAYRYRID